MRVKEKTIVINIFGLNGKDKYALAVFILYKLLLKGFTCKFISDFSADASEFGCPMYTTGKRLYDIQSAYGTVDYIITDTPIVEDCIYSEMNSSLNSFTITEFNKFNNFNICINDAFQSFDNIAKDWLEANDISYITVDKTDNNFNTVVETVCTYNDSYYVDKQFTSTLDIRSQLWAEAQNDGFVILEQSNNDEMFYQYTFKNKKIKYIIRISDKPCTESTWGSNFGYNASETKEKVGYELRYISYVISDEINPYSKPIFHYNENCIEYKEIYFSTVTNDEYDLYSFKESISNLRSYDVDESLLKKGNGILLSNVGQCIINNVETLYDHITFEPVLLVMATKSKDGKEYTTTNPYRDIIEFETN